MNGLPPAPGPAVAGRHTSAGSLRLAELVAALSLATDLGMGQPMEQALRTCVLTVRLGEHLGLRGEALADAYYVALLRFVGCTADAHEAAALAGGDELQFRAAVAPALGGGPAEFLGHAIAAVGGTGGPLRRGAAVARLLAGVPRLRAGVAAHCEMAQMLAARLGLTPAVQRGLTHALERWDGKGLPGTVKGGAIALPARIVFLARDAEVLYRAQGPAAARATIRVRRGAAYDPAVVDAFEAAGIEALAALQDVSPWQEALAVEPAPRRLLAGGDLDGVLEVFADFADLKSIYTPGHSRGVAALAEVAATRLPALRDQAGDLRRAGLLHDLGRTGVPNGVWEKSGPLTESDWERVRLHAYYTERILSRTTALAPLAMLAGTHHERLDGSGYHRGAMAPGLPAAARLLAAADAF